MLNNEGALLLGRLGAHNAFRIHTVAAAAPQKAIDKTDGCHFSPCVLFLFGAAATRGEKFTSNTSRRLCGVRFILPLRGIFTMPLFIQLDYVDRFHRII
jgi:hypothetical protein